MVALNYARGVKIGSRSVAGVMLGDRQVWPTWPVDMFYEGQSLHFDYRTQRYGTKSLADGSVTYTTNVSDLGILTRASTATYWGPEGLLLEAAVDEARIQHDPVTGEPLGVLIEPSATNLINNSEDLASTQWSFANSECIPGFEGPGGIPAFKWRVTAGDGTYGVYLNEGYNQHRELDSYSSSVYVKAGTYRYCRLSGSRAANAGVSITVDLQTGEASRRGETEGRVEPVGDGWFKISLLRPTNTYGLVHFALYMTSYAGGSDSAHVVDHSEDDYIYVAAPQFEAGTPSTSYIPTSGSSVTRAADNVVIDLSDVFNPDEGTLRITAQVPEGGVVASLGELQVVSDSEEFKEYDLNYISHSGNTVAHLGEGIFNKVEYFPEMQGELGDLIRTLYGNGEQGAMYIPEPKVLGYQVLYQDAEGTVPVESDGDPVGLMLDLSGNGNHASQETSAARPVYLGLEYDGVDDQLLSIPSNQLPIPFTVAVKFSPYAVSDSSSGAYRVFSRGSGNGTRGAIAVNAGNVYINTDGGSGFNVVPVSPFDEVTLVVRFLPESTVVHIGGQEVVGQRFVSEPANNTPATIGAQTGSGNRNFEGKIGPLIVVGRDVGPEVADKILEYLSGVML